VSAVAVVGAACRYPEADGPDELWRNILSQRRAFRRIPLERLRSDDYFAADRDAPDRTYALTAAVLDEWKFNRLRFRISGSTFRSTDLAHWLALEIAADALADAGFPDGEGLDRDRTLVVVGNTLTGEFSRAHALRLRWPYVRRVVAAALAREGQPESERRQFLAELETAYKAPFPSVDGDTLAGALSNTIAGRICNVFDLKGGGYTVDGACAASLLAVITAATAVERGDVDVAVAGGVDLSLDPLELVGFAKAGALADSEMRVYDARPNGFWPGEGCGFVVLRRLSDAERDGQDGGVVIRGWGISSDGAGGITRPEAAGQVLALRRAYAQASFGIDTVDLFEGHGTGTSIGDATELATLEQARHEADAVAPAAIGSIKANIGHTKAAAGIAGFLKATMSLREQVIPPTSGCIEPHPDLLRDDATLRIVRGAELWPAGRPQRAAVSAMGFGGINTHVVLERTRARPRRRALTATERRLSDSWQDAEVFLFAGDPDSLAEAVEELRRDAPTLSFAELADAGAELYKRLQPGELRAAVVAASPAELELSLRALAEALAAGKRRVLDSHLALAWGPPPTLGYLFTGQGAAASPDGGAFARRFAWARHAFERARLPRTDDRVDTAFVQPAVVTASLVGLELLRRLGVEATIATGHSLGELTALHWGGAFDADDVVEIARRRGRAMSERGASGGAMAALVATRAEAERLVAGTAAVLAGLNAARQTVVSGPGGDVAAVVERAEREGIRAASLRVSHAFHSPLVEAAAQPLAAVLAAVPARPLARRVVSTVTGTTLVASEDLRDLLVRQVTSPVTFAAALAEVETEADVLVEVGPGSSLARLASEATDCAVLSLDVGGPSLRPALSAVAKLFALGVPLSLDEFFGKRFTRSYELGRRRSFLANPCEQAPADDSGPPIVEVAPSPDVAAQPAAALDVVREIVAARIELPVEAVRDDDRLLRELHLSSIAVAEITAAAAHRLGLSPPAAPSDLAGASVAELAAALERLAATAPEPEPSLAAGVASWVRAYETVLVERPFSARAAPTTQWHVVGPVHEVTAAGREAFGGDGETPGILLVLPAGAEGSVAELVLEAAREIRDREATRFAVLQFGRIGAAVARVLHLETGIDTCVIRLAGTEGLAAARAEADNAQGFLEVTLGPDQTRAVPVLRPLDFEPNAWPLVRGDVLLVTGGGKGIGAECALALAREHELVLGLIGRSDPVEDEELADNLRRLAAAGVRAHYVRADVGDPEAVSAAVAEVEVACGRVVGILHASGVNSPALLSDLEASDFEATLRPKVAGLQNVLAAVDEEELKLVVGFGSIIARIGLRGEAHYALANEWLGALLADLQRRAPGCRCLNVEWSVWAGVGMGERLGGVDALARGGVTAIPVDEGVALLEQLIRTRGLPSSVVATGRFGPPPTADLERRDLPLLRFLEHTLVDYPGVELVVEAELSAASDPYLADHVLDGVPLLPAVVGLEAMAQTASALGVEAPHAFEDVVFSRPVTVPVDGTRRIRVAALRRPEGPVDVVVRSDETGFQAEHFRAVCRTGIADARPRLEEPPPARSPLAASDVYDALLFHGRRFRRIRAYRTVAARTCAAEIEPAHSRWFGEYLPQRLVLGDPGARDAFVHLLQACIPHVRVLPVGVRRIEVGTSFDEPLVVVARERDDDDATLTWDLEVRDPTGQVRERWEGLALQRLGGMRPPAAWPAGLLGPYLERRLAEISRAHVQVALARRNGPRQVRSADTAIAAAVQRPVDVRRRDDGKPEIAGLAVSAAHLDGYTVAIAGDGVVACDAEAATQRAASVWRDVLGADRFALAQKLALELREDLDTSAARLWATAECVRKAGRPVQEPLAVARGEEDGWTVLRAGRSAVATYVARLTDVEAPVAFAFLIEAAR
jgi:enediyne polyketide synthase